MRNNQPVTNREVFMEEGSVIVSSTDIHGRIQTVNKDFLDIAGYTKEETIGQPHNFIRHPDMPPEAFEDMWRDLKDGKPWSGYVKNRTKSGDHYWVQANAMPVVENGQITGFISVRSKPDSKVTGVVEEIYRKFREGNANGLAILHGQVIGTTKKAQLSRWYERLGSKVLCTSAVLCIMTAVVGSVGIYVASEIKESLRTVYEDRTVAAGQLENVEQANYDSLVSYYTALSTKTNLSEITKKIEEDRKSAEKEWADYMATYLTPEEKILAADYAKKQDRLKSDFFAPADASLKQQDFAKLQNLLIGSGELFKDIDEAMDKLIDLQMRVAKEEYEKGKMHASAGLIASSTAIGLVVVVGLLGARFLKRKLTERLNYLDTRLKSIATGNFATEVTLGNDELQGIMTTVRALQAKLAYGELEKKEAEREKLIMQEKLAADFEQSVKGIVSVVAAAATELSQTASSMVSTVMESSQKATEASSAAGATASNVQAVAAAAEELSASVREISSQVQKTSQLVTLSQEKTKNADDVASALSKASDRVTAAMQMISGIAGQINLLALNATIESARAGEAGKGFAVVASEVKNLAGQTDKTVNEIQSVVEEMRNTSQAIVSALAAIGSSVGSITEASASVASAVEEQSAVTSEIAKNMQNAASGTKTISNNLSEVMASSTHAGSASEQMLMASRDLSKQAEDLDTQVDNFLKRIRAS